MSADRPSPPAIRDALERVLASPEFARSERSRAMLRHIVEAELDGRSGDLKGFSIGVDVFGRDSRFDPAHDPVVRVQAGRLRDLLKAYYAGSGREDAIRITVPLGHYVPVYRFSETVGAMPGNGPSPLRFGGSRWLRLLAACLVAAPLAAAAGAYFVPASGDAAVGHGIAATTDGRRQEPRPLGHLGMLPLVAVTTQGGPDQDAVETLLRAGLSGFDAVELAFAGPDEGSDPDFVMAVGAGPAPGEIVIELSDARDARVLVTRMVKTGKGLEDSVADLLTGIAPVSGLIYARLRESRRETPLTRCLFLGHTYYADQTAEHHRAAYRCFEDLLEAGVRSSLVYSELAGLHLEAVTDRHPYPPRANTDQALDLARRGVALGPLSSTAHRAMGFVLTGAGETDESLRWMKKAHELNRFNLGMAASYGYSLVWAGRYAEGAEILRRAVSVSSTRPTWWDYTLFLADFMQGQMDRAAATTDALAVSRRSHYLAARLLAARHAGDERRADALLDEIGRAYPSFAVDPRSHFERAQYPHDLTDRLVHALEAAGLGRRS